MKSRVRLYDLDAIISVGYRVNSRQAVHFRQWATRILRERLTQGWPPEPRPLRDERRELEFALELVRKKDQRPELDVAIGRGRADIIARYA